MSLWRFLSRRRAPQVGAPSPRLRGIARDRAGTVAIIVAFAIIPLIGAVGIATDTARGYLVKSRLQSAVDSAALAGGRVFNSQTRDDDIRQFFTANFPAGYMNAVLTPLDITPDAVNNTIALTAQATIPTTFMMLLGETSMTLKAYARVTRRTERLHVVLAMDMSLSMNSTMGTGDTRLEAAQAAAHTLVQILFGTNAENDLLKVGMVPYTGKVNVTTGEAYTGFTAVDVSSFTHPVPLFTNPAPSYQTASASSAAAWKYISPNAGLSRSTIYYANNSPVPLLDQPPAGWTGCVYARFTGDTSTAADLLLGPQTVNGTDWPGWVPMGADVATRTAPYSVSTGNGMLVGGLFGVALESAASGADVDMEIAGTHTLVKKTSQSWSSGSNIYWDDPNRRTTTSSTTTVGTGRHATTYSNTLIGTAASSASSSASTGNVKLRVGLGGDAQSGSNNSSNSSPNNVCLDTHAYANSTSSGNRTSDCAACPTVGITPLQSDRTTIDDAIDALNIPFGAQYYTDIPDGLAWAWEVLMPTAPFTEGEVSDAEQSPPRAIVIMTDGANTCAIGDAYQNYSGCGVGGDNSWRNQRLQDLATKIKESGVYIYAIQFAEEGNAGLLQSIATKTIAPYYYYAPTSEDLQNAFSAIANDLSNLRLSR